MLLTIDCHINSHRVLQFNRGTKPFYSVSKSDNREFSEQLKERDQGDRVDVGESLDDVDDLVAQDVVDEAKLEA